MTQEEAEKKAEEAADMDLIERDQIEEYAKYLYEKSLKNS